MKWFAVLNFMFFSLTPIGFASSESHEIRALSFELVDNRILIDAFLNGSGPFKMILDSNSSSLTVSLATASKLNLPLNNPTACNAVGATPKTCYDTHLESAVVAGFQTQVSDAAVVPIEDIQKAIGFKQLDGVVGVHFFEEHVLRFDFSQKQIRIYPSSADLAEQGSVVSLAPDNHFSEFLAVEASVDGKPGFFDIDTGDRSDLTVFKPFDDRWHVKDQYSKIISTITGQGGSGPVHGDIVRLKGFEIGPIRYSNFPTRFPDPKDFSSDKMSGSIGNGLLKHFDYVFDHPHKRLIFLKATDDNYQYYDRSGLWLTSMRQAFLVSDVVANSSAARAGLQLNDQIIEIDGQGVASSLLPEFREKLENPKTQSVKIRIKRGKNTLSTVLILRDLI